MSTTTSGQKVTKVSEEDFLDQDPEIRGQSYACISFVSPEDVLQRKDVFQFSKFTESIAKDVANLLTTLDEKYAGKDGGVVKDMVSGIRERHAYLTSTDAMKQEFASYIAENSIAIDRDFAEIDGYRTSIRGFKIRGTYETLAEAKARAHKIRSIDAKFNVFVAQVGCWCPWSPNPEEIADNEYAEDSLNTLMKSYKDNAANKDEFYEKRKGAFMDNAKSNNKEKSDNNGQQYAIVDESQVPAEFRVPDTTTVDTWVQKMLDLVEQVPIQTDEVPEVQEVPISPEVPAVP